MNTKIKLILLFTAIILYRRYSAMSVDRNRDITIRYTNERGARCQRVEAVTTTKQRNRLIRLLRWPEDNYKGTVPWFVMLCCLVAWPLMYTGFIISWCGIALAFGISTAKKFWRNIV